MIDFLEYAVSHGFWVWLGIVLLITIPLNGLYNFIFRVYNRKLRFKHMEDHGYPPAHCDADGDFHKKEEN